SGLRHLSHARLGRVSRYPSGMHSGGMLGRALLIASMAAAFFIGGPTSVLADEVDDARARLNIINHLKGTLSDNLQRAEAQEIAMQQQLQETQDQINTTIQ